MLDKVLVIFLVLLGCAACSDDDDNSDDDGNASSCESDTVVDSSLFVSAPDDIVTINMLEINEDCLTINFSSSGCNGDTWEVVLIDSDEVLESLPPQRNVRLSLNNDELCQAFITQELTFDISMLRTEGSEVQLNFENSEDGILYQY